MNRFLHNISRSILFTGGVAAAGTAYMLFEAQWLKTTHRRIVIGRLPSALDGLRILHVSDLHAGAHGLNDRSIAKFIRTAGGLEPDIILFTGDMTDKSRDLRPYLGSLASLQARYGKFAVLGNHDHGLRKTVIQDLTRRLTGRSRPHPMCMTVKQREETVRRCRGLLAEANIWLLDNECVSLKIGDESVQLCGVDDYQYGLSDLEAVGRQLEAEAGLRVFLSHSPDAASHVRSGNFQLMLAGHTHGGQVCLPNPRNGKTMLSTSGSEYGEGLYQIGDMVLHVSRGVGTTLVPLRLMSRPEITLLQLFSYDRSCAC